MKRFALLGVILAAGLGFGVYQMTRSDASSTQASSQSSAPSASQSAKTPADVPPGTPLPAPHRPSLDRPVDERAARMIQSQASTSESASATPETAAGASDASATTSPSSGSKRTGMDVVKPAKKPGQVEPPPTKDFASEQGQAQEKRMNRAFEAARCRAPGMAQRYAALDADGKKKLREQCAAVGVTLAE